MVEIDHGNGLKTRYGHLSKIEHSDDGLTAPAKVASLDDRTLRITIHEGRNRQVRRMVEAVGSNVLRLVRVRIGPLTDRSLKPGEWRELTQDELRALERAVAAPPARPARRRSGDRGGTTSRPGSGRR